MREHVNSLLLKAKRYCHVIGAKIVSIFIEEFTLHAEIGSNENKFVFYYSTKHTSCSVSA